MTHLLVTNDFPPKVGGIQTYLWELWRRLPPEEFAVIAPRYRGAEAWDRDQPFAVHRVRERVLLPRQALVQLIREKAEEIGAGLVVLDPALPLGMVGARLGMPYALVVHGAEVTVPGRLPVTRRRLTEVLRGARGVVAAGRYPSAEVTRLFPSAEVAQVPPGVDLQRFQPLSPEQRRAARARLGLPQAGPLIVSASRLVPRKGIDVVIDALPYLVPHRPDLMLAVVGAGRDTHRLRVRAGRLGVAKRVEFLGRVPDDALAAAYACGDVFAMLCRNRWGGLEQEGFGIVFLEAAASGVPQVAGDSGGAAEAVADGETGFVMHNPKDAAAVAAALARLLDDRELRDRMGGAGRARAVQEFDWDCLAVELHAALRGWGS
jgi:phosphatidylinositol alpha-1,6-mannosyltransferase